jgi:hypothetical protein
MSFSCCVMSILFVWLWWCAGEDFLFCDVCDCHSGVDDSVFWDDKQCRFVNGHLICLLFDTALTSQKTRIVDMLSYVCRYHPRWSLCSRAAIFLLWAGEYYYLHICSVIKTSGFYLPTELTSVRLRLELISCPRFPVNMAELCELLPSVDTVRY